jgi:hypothetical protein
MIKKLPTLPAKLEWLYCSSTLITYLPILPTGLNGLFCDNTYVWELPTLPKYLNTLNCTNTKISVLPELPKILFSLKIKNTHLLIKPNKNEQIEDYEDRWKPIRIEQEVLRTTERVNSLKEELIAFIMHPDRIQTLVDTYGIEILDNF